MLPRSALTIISSLLAVPPFFKGGENVTRPFHTPPAVLHVTLPGRTTGFVTARAAPDSAVTIHHGRQ